MIPAIYTHVAAVLLGGALAAASTWGIQGWRLGGQIAALQAQHATAKAKAEADARAAQLTIDTTYQEALNAARTRETSLRRERDAARTESDGLREQSADAARRLAAAAPAAVLEYATAVNELFADCGRSYQELAGTADGHAADVGALIGAWPMNPSQPDAWPPHLPARWD